MKPYTYPCQPRVRGNLNPLDPCLPCVRSIPASAGEPATTCQILPQLGLSPRVRGNPYPGLGRIASQRSIPASAGYNMEWNPRECNGLDVGLSPRVRGDRPGGGADDSHARSIPASAGERWRDLPWDGDLRSIPASAGEPGDAELHHSGLSPRVRGNPQVYPRECGGTGSLRWPVRSIPASAGEPACLRVYPREWRVYPRECWVDKSVYPRECGGTEEATDAMEQGSIPASAGEPIPWPGPNCITAVYPRECGGTRRRSRLQHGMEGLSPRVRGNQGLAPRGRVGRGSIPASAGGPARWRRR